MRLKFTKILILFFVLTTQISFAQQKTVFGVVTEKAEDRGIPLPGVSVVIKGTQRGTETNFDGKYSLKVKENDVLIFSFLGMKTIEKPVQGLTTIDVVFESDTTALDEVVVTGYDTTSKKKFTGAASTIKAEDLKIDGIVDVSRMLEGKIAGVSIQNISGTFGSAPKITIRGSSSIFGNNSPLYVIDGVVQEDIIEQNLEALTSGDASTLISSSIAGINSNDIKTIDVLKDASATSLYGARARNGVVVITTKGGRRSSSLKINYTIEQTMKDIPNYSNYDILNSKETVSILQELRKKSYLRLPNVGNARYSGIYGIVERRIDGYKNGRFGVVNVVEARNRFLRDYELANTNWFNVLFKNNISQNHSLSFSGGGENNAYYASMSLFTDPGWSISDKVTRFTTSLKNTFYISNKFNLTLSAVSSIRNQKAPGSFSRRADVVDGRFSRDFDINPFSYALNTSRALRPRDNNGNLEYYTNNWAPFNILEELKNNLIDLDVKDFRFQTDASYKITNDISYELNASVRYVNSTREHQIKENSNVIKAYNQNKTPIIANANRFLYRDLKNPNAIPIPVFPEGGIYIKNDNYLTSFYFRNNFKYDSNFGDKHDFNALLGQEVRYVDRKRNQFTAYGLQYDKGYVPSIDARLLEKIINESNTYYGIGEERERTVAFFGKTTYMFDDKYIFSATGRYDGSNRQGRSAKSRWLPTGTVSVKWIAKNEKFLSDNKTVSNLQFRTSYGLVATPGSATNALAIFRSEIAYRRNPLERETYLDISNLENSELTWEKQYELNLGVDLGLFDNRIQFTADVYNRDIFDNIDLVRTSGIGGEFTKFGNNADVTTKGLELSLTTKNIKGDDFSWTTSINFSYYNQKIDKLKNQPRVIDIVREIGGNVEGYPINSLFSFKFKGLNGDGIPTFQLPEGQNEVTGINFQDIEKVSEYLVFNGSTTPNISGGITNKFVYKNWDLNLLITGSGGNVVRLNSSFNSSYSDINVFTKDFINRWIFFGDEKITTIPKIADIRTNNEIGIQLSPAYNAYNYSNVRVAKGDFIRFKNISLGYSLPKDLIKKLGLSLLKIKAQATNLFLFYSDSKLNGQDPEFYRTGGVAFPITRQYTLSLNIGF